MLLSNAARVPRARRPASSNGGLNRSALAAFPGTASLLPAAVAAAAAASAAVGTIPGQRLGVRGMAVEGVAWALLYVGGVVACRAAAGGAESDDRRLRLRLRVGAALVLALATANLVRLAAAPLLAPAQWGGLVYLRWLVPPAAAAAWCAVLLPDVARSVVRRVVGGSTASPLPELAALLAVAVLLVSCADLAFLWSGATAANPRALKDAVLPRAWAANAVVLFGAFALVFALTARLAAALVVVAPPYAALVGATLAKLTYMHSAVQPLDVLRVPELLPLLGSFFGSGSVVGAAVASVLWLGALAMLRRTPPSPARVVRRSVVGVVAAALLVVPLAGFHAGQSHPRIRRAMGALGAPEDSHREFARQAGVLLSFLRDVPSTFVSAPEGYSRAAVAGALARYRGGPPAAVPGERGGVNVIVYLIESFVDPADLDFIYTSDPIPTIRELGRSQVSGHVIVPEAFGGSANTEFEVLTGMSRALLPAASLPYRQYVRRPVPSLPRALADAGYATAAIQADPRHFYDRVRVYPLLGFERAMWLHGAPGVERAPRGRWPADAAVVDSIVRVSQGARPFFVFAFPSSTHSPYNTGAFGRSDLRVLNPAPLDTAGEAQEYVNALRVADRAVSTLIRHFSQRGDSTIIVILGDHLPPLSAAARQRFSAKLATLPPAEQARLSRRVPLRVWANFGLPREEVELSSSALAAYVLDKARVPPRGFLAASDAVRRRVPVLSRDFARAGDGRVWARDSLPATERALLRDYALLQYDHLLGRAYAGPP